MIENVTISELGVIEYAELPLHSGFNVVTGETGAGKTMVVTALGLLLGARAEASSVRRGAERAGVDAELTVDSGHQAITLSREAGAWFGEDGPQAPAQNVSDEPVGREQEGAESNFGEPEPGDRLTGRAVELILGRVVSAKGRSRAAVGGRAVPVSLLGEIGGSLVTVHGQSDQLRLKSASAQRRALDRYAGPDFLAELEEYQRRYREYRVKQSELEEITTHERERRREAEQLQQALERIDETDPQPREDEQLRAESLKLENVESLREAARTAQHALSGPDAAEVVGAESASAVEQVEAASSAVAAVADQDEELGQIVEQISSVSALINDAANQLGLYAAGLDESGPERLAQVHSRRAELDRLLRLYGPDIEAVLTWAEKSRARLAELQSDQDRIESLGAEVTELESTVRRQAEGLRRRREEAGERLAEAVGEELASLAMPQARIVAEVVETSDLGPHGADTVALLLAPHSGADPLPLGRGASGGELSRVMLALEVVLAAHDSAGTFIFDEVDAGVGGKAAVQIGRRLAMLAQHVQVIVVTHLPQVAAFAQNHIRVFKESSKDDAGGFTSSDITVLDGEDRVGELARMLAGQEDSEAAREHARELLETAAA